MPAWSVNLAVTLFVGEIMGFGTRAANRSRVRRPQHVEVPLDVE